jgi:hypothetical protein
LRLLLLLLLLLRSKHLSKLLKLLLRNTARELR